MPKYFVVPSDVAPAYKSHGRANWPMVTRSTVGTTGFAMGLHICQPGGGSGGPHVHESESETMYITQGRARFTVGEEERICEPDTVVHAPAGVPHGFENLGEGELKFIWLFQPPLPEHQ